MPRNYKKFKKNAKLLKPSEQVHPRQHQCLHPDSCRTPPAQQLGCPRILRGKKTQTSPLLLDLLGFVWLRNRLYLKILKSLQWSCGVTIRIEFCLEIEIERERERDCKKGPKLSFHRVAAAGRQQYCILPANRSNTNTVSAKKLLPFGQELLRQAVSPPRLGPLKLLHLEKAGMFLRPLSSDYP